MPVLALAHGAVLRQWEREDAAQLVAAWADADSARWNQVPADPTLATAQDWIEGQDVRRQRRLSLDAVVVPPGGQAIVGEVGLSGFSPTHRGAVIGYWMLPEGRGQGLAGQAVDALCTWAGLALNLDVMIARCHQSNEASQRVAARAGFVHHSNAGSGDQLWRRVLTSPHDS